MKILKCTKFIFCLIIVVSMIAPSYAALSSTDGSVFITKSEFDSALTNFNARLTSFESGINSKIDSQVTSYLDRNGIWSGTDQMANILQHQTYWWGFKNVSANKTAAAWQISFTPDFQKTNLAYGWINDRLVIPDCTGFTKSGLLFINHVWIGLGPEAHLIMNTNGSGNFDDYWNGCMSLNITISTGRESIVRRLGYGDCGNYHNNKSNLHFEDFNCSDMMFVSKGDIPVWNTEIKASGTHGSGIYLNFQMNRMNAQGSTPITDDWDIEEKLKTITSWDRNTFGGIFSAGWYKVKSLVVY